MTLDTMPHHNTISRSVRSLGMLCCIDPNTALCQDHSGISTHIPFPFPQYIKASAHKSSSP